MAAAEETKEYTLPDQIARHALNSKNGLADITGRYDGSLLQGKRVLVTGGNRGLGLALVKELISQNAEVIATCRKPSEELTQLNVQVIDSIDVTQEECMKKMVEEIDAPLDIVINNAGYFYGPVETIETLNFEEEKKMIDICAIGPLRISSALINGNKLTIGAKIAMITSQGGSITWRDVQNPNGQDYGHHMSKAAANMMGKLLAQEMKSKGIIVYNLHPGFCRTEMTSKYSDIWDIEGAVESSIGAKRVCHEVNLMNLENTGSFINCEDGLLIPW